MPGSGASEVCMASQEMLRWQYKNIIAELQQLQLHASDGTCPCLYANAGEYCLPKHALMVASLASETVAMDPANTALLQQLADEANQAHETLRDHVCGQGEDIPLLSWSREWRKKVEAVYYTCDVAALRAKKTRAPEEQPRWCFPVKEVERGLGRVTRELGIMQSKAKQLKKQLDMPIQICKGQVEMFQEPAPDAWGSRCRDPMTGRWVPSEECPAVPTDPWTIEGKELTWAISPIGVLRYDFAYRVYEANELIPSHDPFTFEPNPGFPQELQPRLRERAAPRVQVAKIAATLDPGLLLEDYHATDRGAPIVGPDMVVESGNGRAMAIILSATEHPGQYAEYRRALLGKAPEYGLDPARIEKMTTPVLVRERITDVVRTDFVAEANATSSISRSTVEIARTDAELITSEMLYDLQVLDGETIEDALRSARNRGLVNRFLGKLPAEEQAGLLDAKGVVNQDGIRRIGTAIFVKAFETADTGLVLAERWFESTEPDVKNVFNGIARALGPLARAESLVAANERDPNLSIAQDLTAAVSAYSKVRKLQMRVEDYLAQMPMWEREIDEFQEKILIALHDRRRSPRRIGEMLSVYANLVIDSPHPAQVALIEVATPNKEAFWAEAMRKTEREPEPAAALFQNVCFAQSPAYQITIAGQRVTFAPGTIGEMTRMANETKKREVGFELCDGTDGMLRPGRRCKGAACSIRLTDCGPDRSRGFFHTHPAEEEYRQRSFSVGDLLNVANRDKMTCVSGSTITDIICAKQKPGTSVPRGRPRAYAYMDPTMPPEARRWLEHGHGRIYFPSVGAAFDYVEIPKKIPEAPPVKSTGEQLRLFRKPEVNMKPPLPPVKLRRGQNKAKPPRPAGALKQDPLLSEIASKICAKGSCFAGKQERA